MSRSIQPEEIRVFPLATRPSDICIEDVARDPAAAPPDAAALNNAIDDLAERIVRARRQGAAVMLTYGAHLIKNGGGTLVNALMDGGWLTHVATQGAGVIHDWEFAFQGKTSESVRANAPIGRFGAWDETGRAINLAALSGACDGLGLGESIGRFIQEDGPTLPDAGALAALIAENPEHPLTAARADLLAAMRRFDLPAGKTDIPHLFKQYSVPTHAYARDIPFTVHPGIGYDIYTNHPLFHGGALGRTAAQDARTFARSTETLSGGVYLSVGSAIMSPQVFEKAFSLANNVREQQSLPYINNHTIAVVDLQDDSGWNWSRGEPPKHHPAYYLRFLKSFHRLGGDMMYLNGDNCLVLHNLLERLRRRSGGTVKSSMKSM